MEHLALNVYLHGAGEQQAFISGALAPALASLHAGGVLRRAWFTRFDARGPHVAVLVSTAPAGAPAARRALADAVEAWLAAHPPVEALDDAALEQRHAECRGKRLSAMDVEPGFAAVGSFAFAPHPAAAYPFHIFAEDDDAAWALLTEHTIANAAGPPPGQTVSSVALRWLAAVDHALAAAGADAAGYWRHHAATLLPNLPERLRDDEAAVLDALPRTVGERNLAAMDRVWAAVAADAGDPAVARAGRLVRTLLAGREPAAAWPLLREANHCGLLQMALPVRAHVPAVLYAWQRALHPVAA